MSSEHTGEYDFLLRLSVPDAVTSYVNLLVDQNRVADAIAVAEKALKLSADSERWAAENKLGREYESKKFRIY